MDVKSFDCQPGAMIHEQGQCWMLPLPDPALAELLANPRGVCVSLYEDGARLGPNHARLPKLRAKGGGLFFIWRQHLYFSSSDNTDPVANGRIYRLVVELPEADEVMMPTVMHLGLSSSCNLTCRICRNEQNNQHLSDQSIDTVVTEIIPHLRELRLDVDGEPTVHKRNFRRVVETATRHNVSTFVCTNATLIDEELADFICTSSITRLQLSIDSPVSENLEWVRRGARYDDVVGGIRNLVRARTRHGNDDLHFVMHAALLGLNVGDLPDLVRLAHELGVESVSCMFGFIHSYMQPEWSVFWQQERHDRMIDEAAEVASQLGIRFLPWGRFSDQMKPPQAQAAAPSRVPCSQVYGWTYVDPKGNVYPCCISTAYALGNLHEQSFRDIWFGEKYQELRRTHNTSQPSNPKCAACYISGEWNKAVYQPYFAFDHWPAVEQRLGGVRG